MKKFKILSTIGIISVILALSLGFWMGCGSNDSNETEISYSAAPPSDVLEHVKAVQEKHTKELMETPSVVGTAVGLDINNNPAIYVLTEKQDIAGLPKNLDSIPVVIEVTGKIKALKRPGSGIDRTARFDRPVPIGVSTGHPDITAGTIGCRVKDNAGKVYALSNNHVYANENRANIGDNVLQPGAYDGGKDPADAIGMLYKFKPINFSGANNVIDAAIASSSTGTLDKSTPSDGYGTPKSATADALIGMNVIKYGRTTGLTTGKVYLLNATVNVGYDSGTAKFVNQIIITPGKFSAGGDSGSLIVTQSGKNPVGLLFAGSNTITIANPIGAVLNYLGVAIDGQ